MPLFEYRCRFCEVVDEILGRPEDVVECDLCGAEMEKLPSSGSFRMSGRTWHETMPGGPPRPIDEDTGKVKFPWDEK